MPKRVFRIREGEPLLDIVSYGRGGPRNTGGHLSPAQVEYIQRTVHRVPEAVVKVLPRASNDLKAVGKHLDYISRYGRLDLETDNGERLADQSGKALLCEWDLDIDAMRRQAELRGTKGRKLPKLIHKVMFSMPPGTPPEKVRAAVRAFAREEFWGQHRYAFVLHTDEEHPHVHLVLKAMSEQGARLNIRKATLRHWRSEFARNLRLLGVAANATERAVRGDTRSAKKDGIYRAGRRGDSTYIRAQLESVAKGVLSGSGSVNAGTKRLLETRATVVRGWKAVALSLAAENKHDLARRVEQFIQEMAPALTDREAIARRLLSFARRRQGFDQGDTLEQRAALALGTKSSSVVALDRSRDRT